MTLKADMLTDNPAKAIITFAVPVVLGNIFQQLYNTVDAIIVGRFLGKNALAAVGVANPIMSIIIFFIFGICVGMSMLMAQLYGSQNYKGFKEEASTSLIAGTVFTIFISIICFYTSDKMLFVTNTPTEILYEADKYLKIIFAGLFFSFLYNYYSSSLRALGDSKTPFIFLLISSVANIILDIVFIAVFNTGVAGAAAATVLSQALSSILCIIYTYKHIPLLSLKKSEFVFKKDILLKTLNYSWASAVQQTFIYIGRLLVQGLINPIGTTVIAAYNSATRIESFVFSPYDAISTSVATYSAQNIGAEQYKRIKNGLKISMFINITFGIIMCVFLILFSSSIMSIFMEPSISAGEMGDFIDVGSVYLKNMAVFYLLSACSYSMQGLFRGVGKIKTAMTATVLQIIIRVALSYKFVPMFGVSGICYSVGIGWLVMNIYDGINMYFYLKKINNKKAS